ncbi:MAG: tetratricopeptide repeat protein, partial [Bacteroides sp.]|nr:tetratricopeptide repeat protein [Bacteroides sp.]
MSKKNLMSGKDKELQEMAESYENAQKENKTIYLDADDLADLADWYAMRYQYDKANEVVNYGLKIHPDNTILLIEQAYLFLDTNQRDKSKAIMDCIPEETSEAKVLKANLLMGDGKIEEAEALLGSIEDKDELGNIIDVSYMYLDLGLPELALPWLERGVERYAENESYLAVTGDCYHALGRVEDAMGIFNRLIDKNPYSAFYWYGLASCYFDLQMFDKAIEACDYALVTDEEFASAYMLRGHAFFQIGNDDRAIEDFLVAKERNSLSPNFVNIFIA